MIILMLMYLVLTPTVLNYSWGIARTWDIEFPGIQDSVVNGAEFIVRMLKEADSMAA